METQPCCLLCQQTPERSALQMCFFVSGGFLPCVLHDAAEPGIWTSTVSCKKEHKEEERREK